MLIDAKEYECLRDILLPKGRYSESRDSWLLWRTEFYMATHQPVETGRQPNEPVQHLLSTRFLTRKSRKLIADPNEHVENRVKNLDFRPGFRPAKLENFGLKCS